MIDFEVTPDAGEMYKVTATSRDVYVFEKTNKGKSFAQIMNDVHMTDMYRLAHLAAKRQQMFDGTLDDFVGSVDITPIEDDGGSLRERLAQLLNECTDAELDEVPIGDLRALLLEDGEPDPTQPEASPEA